MPLVRITVSDARDDAALAALGEAVHDALVETLQVPPDDRFQIHDRRPAAQLVADPRYLGIERRDPVVVEVTLRAGRTVELKRAFYRRLVELAAARADIRPQDVMIVLRENELADWSFGDGVAQYAPDDAAAPVTIMARR
jgi:phenylpyruvate tautomerase PptA (4-oxalocrotonate tautomerase family)